MLGLEAWQIRRKKVLLRRANYMLPAGPAVPGRAAWSATSRLHAVKQHDSRPTCHCCSMRVGE